MMIVVFNRMHSTRGMSQPFYREKLYETVMGYKDLEDFLVNFWEKYFLSKGRQCRVRLYPCNRLTLHL